MLTKTFRLTPGIGQGTERGIWATGTNSWDRFLQDPIRAKVNQGLTTRLLELLPVCKTRLQELDARFFADRVPRQEHWRLFKEFASKTVYVDIETTGLSHRFDDITVIGVYDGRNHHAFVKGQNLAEFEKTLSNYQVMVTFNGLLFDVPFIKEKFPSVALPPVHLDLRFLLKRLGYSGGLKAIERKLNVWRASDIEDVDGYQATVLWQQHLRGVQEALPLLIRYNLADTANLKWLMEFTYQHLAKSTTARDKKGAAPAARPVQLRQPSIVGGRTVKFGDQLIEVSSERPNVPRYDFPALLSRLPHTDSPQTVVGIDLSGSAKRPTGWALLRGQHVETMLLRTDDELIQKTLATKPDLVSIDSPLTLPTGRHCTSDSCWCRKHGIVREAERQLRRWGVSVFWCLLPSMQGLTNRGMSLAREFRERGVKVIESFPGAAQDVLQIPRKKTSREELREGLLSLGLQGEFRHSLVSHDELDAITSALVGYFYLSGDYEAVGTEQEGVIIIPKTK
jgi:uncharacterized protein YprB with RNaseH-like and TPR domain/predicted nuclease with RNAse H fold